MGLGDPAGGRPSLASLWGIDTGRTGRTLPARFIEYINELDAKQEHIADHILALLDTTEVRKRGDDAVLAKLLQRERDIREKQRLVLKLAREVEEAARRTERTQEYARARIEQTANQARRYATFIRHHLGPERAKRIVALDRAAGVEPVMPDIDDRNVAALLREMQDAQVTARAALD